jgi:cytoskeletal protein RodZ
MHRSLAVLLTLAALLAVPATALAQSAGDEQYVDPFQGGEQQPSEAPQEAPAEAPAEATEPAPAEPAPAAPTAPAAPSDAAGEAAAAPAQADAPTLPRTGGPMVLLAAIGYALLLAGVAIRRKA